MPLHPDETLAAIKRAVDIAHLIGDYLPLQRSGSKFKALCPFHDDHNPSLEINPERQSFKCWSCGTGGDVFDFVKHIERVDFPEALRMLAERAGVALDTPGTERAAPSGPSKSDLLAVMAWAEGQFRAALAGSAEARAYLEGRSISRASVERFALGFAPDDRDWLALRARRAGFSAALLEAAGLRTRPEAGGPARDRFRARVIFPIRDERGRTIAFGGRILPAAEKRGAEAGRRVAKYLNSPETLLFQKRRTLYAFDLARAEARPAGWVAVMEGYTDVIAAHQQGLGNAVGTLGTALGDEHVVALRRLADRAVLVFDGDEAGQKAADRALELFLGHELDVRVLALPEGLDPCDYLLERGAGPFRTLLERAVDPLEFALGRAAGRFDLESPEEARRAAEWVLAVLARVPSTSRAGLDVKVAKALDALARRLNVPVADLRRRLRELRRPRRRGGAAAAGEPGVAPGVSNSVEEAAPLRPADLDALDRELIQIALNEPSATARLITRVAVTDLRDAPSRAILRACYDLHGEGVVPSFERVALRLTERERALAAGLLLPIDSQPLAVERERRALASWQDRLEGALVRFAERERQDRLRELKGVLDETDRDTQPDAYRALWTEYHRLLNQRPDPRKKSAS